ncbi:DUF433 domain-containing protein [Candidatus Woesearchaeota archaeon]|nr:DUF433 domain-containing protein [Candidatus Woesearchaeota archaeon]
MRVKISRHIVADTEICHGKPTFKGTRVLVSDIVELVAAGESSEKLMKSYPGLSKEMIREALEHAAKVISGERYVKFSKIPA